MSDDQGWGDVAYNGNHVVKTPHLDAMSRECLRFDRFYAAAPVCSPTRGSCLTGRHPHRYGIDWVNEYSLPLSEVTLPEALRGAGYRSGHFGKWHLGRMTMDMTDAIDHSPGRKAPAYSPPWAHGFDVCFSSEINGPTYNPDVWGRDPKKPGNPLFMERPVFWGETTETPGVRKSIAQFWTGPGKADHTNLAGDSSKVIMDRAIEFIETETMAGNPFLAVVWFFSPHSPIAAGNSHREPYKHLTMEEQHWAGCITAMDEQIGRLRLRLRELDVAENTIVWFCSDNGPSWIHHYNSAGPLKGKKGSLHEGGVRVPALLEWPARFPQPRVVSTPISTSDFYPTLLHCAGVNAESQPLPIDGENILPLLDGTAKDRNAPIAFQSPAKIAGDQNWQMNLEPDTRQLALIGDRFKLLSEDNGKTYALYDLLEDAAETADVAAAHPDVLQTMRAYLQEWIHSCDRSRESLQ